MKHWQGEISGDGIQWERRMPNGKTRVVDNPLLLANRKAKRLASLLGHYADRPPRQAKAPYVGAAVFLHAADVRTSLDPVGRQHVYGPPGATASGLPGIGDLLLARRSGGQVDRAPGRAITRLIETAGVRPATAERMVGQLLLAPRPYAEGPGWQDFLAGHQVQTQQVRRVRFYLAARAAPAERDMIMRAAEREYRILQDIHHDGIVHAVDMVEHPLGPAVVFEHEEDSVRLDRWMDEHGGSLGIDQRLALVRQLAETMRYAHSRRLVHRNLNPRSILVQRPDSTRPRLVVIDWQTGGRLPGSSQPSAGGPGTLGGSGTLGGTIHIEQLADEAARVYQAPEIGYADVSGPLLDVFALGALAYLIFTGRPPAAGVAEMRTRLAEAGGLDARFDNPRAVQLRLPGFSADGLRELGRRVRDVYTAGASAGGRVAAVVDDGYVDLLALRVTGALGGKVGVAPRIFLKKLVADVLDRVDLHPDFDPRRDYPVTLVAGELTDVERNAAGRAVRSVDDIELDLP